MEFSHPDHSLVVNVPAKLNLFLEVLARRKDGYHEIENLMVAVSIYDSLFFAVDDSGKLELDCAWASGLTIESGRREASAMDQLPDPQANLVWRAVERLRQRAGVELGAAIRLVKRIPSAAGLGGASGDAAAGLLLANRAWRLNWSREKLSTVAAEIGSDIPFFLNCEPAVFCGRGDQLRRVVEFCRLSVVVVRPPTGLGTADVYRKCRPAETPVPLLPLLSAGQSGNLPLVAKCMTNRLQPAAASLSPWIQTLQRIFEQSDCLGHQMTGSGSSYFGICRNNRHARRIANQIRSMGVGQVFSASTFPTSPLGTNDPYRRIRYGDYRGSHQTRGGF
ncbi:MAG: 4-(cytidine 5'-diphospho)-2-C-methyl-D-erythritol kinase [Planctomycetota bacterium]|nr:4-(cytidine 5'-diphospho)-2-C-methyl-D-erythritol kinase [Planctomycetota bacterium]